METSAPNKKMVISGVTADGRTFRPSNWADRLAGVVSHFRPPTKQSTQHARYSPWCMPAFKNGKRCVIIDPILREKHPQAWDYLVKFAQENNLPVQEAEDTEKVHGTT